MTDDADQRNDGNPAAAKDAVTRESLVDGSFIARLRAILAGLTPAPKVLTDDELAAAQAAFLADRPVGQPLWVFGYGSLMWNPAIAFVERRVGVAQGWSRRFNLWMTAGRGTVERPGLMLGLQRGGEAQGVLMRLDPDRQVARRELSYVWQREGFSDVYLPQWIEADTDGGPVEAITFASNDSHANYAGGLTDREIADVTATAAGTFGSCLDYLDETLASAEALGISDHHLRRIRALVSERPD